MWHLIFSRSISLCPHVLALAASISLCPHVLALAAFMSLNPIYVSWSLRSLQSAALLPHWHSASGPHLSFLISFSGHRSWCTIVVCEDLCGNDDTILFPFLPVRLNISQYTSILLLLLKFFSAPDPAWPDHSPFSEPHVVVLGCPLPGSIRFHSSTTCLASHGSQFHRSRFVPQGQQEWSRDGSRQTRTAGY
jgi:hypothetical protein